MENKYKDQLNEVGVGFNILDELKAHAYDMKKSSKTNEQQSAD